MCKISLLGPPPQREISWIYSNYWYRRPNATLEINWRSSYLTERLPLFILRWSSTVLPVIHIDGVTSQLVMKCKNKRLSRSIAASHAACFICVPLADFVLLYVIRKRRLDIFRRYAYASREYCWLSFCFYNNTSSFWRLPMYASYCFSR